ncbi:MAG: CoA-binding protein [Candidatus Lokiarchaeota archaeon]|nr:CoA-binding protein [Candidatus Lokiarchaeota archaeon]
MKNLDPFFHPSSILIIGVSRKTETFSYTILKNLLEIFYRGKIFILNPNADEILGVKSYHSLEELPEIPELAVIVLSKNVASLFEKLAKFGVKNIVIESELRLDTEKANLIEQLNKISLEYDVAYMGPSMIGIINFVNNFTTSIIPVRQYLMQKHRKIKKGVSFIAQSGGLAGAMGWWAPSQDIPISKVIHLGYGFDIDDADVLDYFMEDESTQIILLFLREITDRIIEAVKIISPIKPVLFFYVGKDFSREKQLSHAGGMMVSNYIELFEFAKIFLWCPEPKGPALGIVGPSSGAIYIIIKEMRKQGLSIAKLSNKNKQTILDKVGGSTCNLGNPVDYWPPDRFVGTKICGIYNTSSHALLQDDAVDGLILALEFFVEIEFDFNIFENIKESYPNKPIVTVLIQAERDGSKRVIKTASDLKIPVFENEVERAVRGYKLLYDWHSKIKKRK